VATKLITSEAYINAIRNFLPEKPNSKTPPAEKSKKIFENIINSSNFIFDESDKRITDYITTLLTIRPGRTLFKRLLKTNQSLMIVFDAKEESGFRYCNRCRNATLISTITLNDDSNVSHYVSVNSNGEKFFTPAYKLITLAHELIHALHFFEEGPEFVAEKANKPILDPDLDNGEEEETIIGKEKEAILCENVFRFHFGYPLRVNHRGLKLNKEDSFTISECASHGTLANLKEMLSSNPSLLNLPHRADAKKKNKTPLNAALWARQEEVSDYLLQAGADINARDDCLGTALHVAARSRRPGLVKVLLEQGADFNVKNPSGLTAFEIAFRSKNDETTELLAPHSNLNEIDKVGRTLLHRAPELGSPEGFRTLIRHGADINLQDLKGNTPLMYFCNFDYTVVDKAKFKQKFKILLENDHLDLNAKNVNKRSALSLAIKKCHYWQVDALVKKGAKIPPNLVEDVQECIDCFNDGIDDDYDDKENYPS
jgi:ankyrin repeat protein